MAITKANGNRSYPTFTNWWDEMFSKDVFDLPQTRTGFKVPAVNIRETENDWQIEVAAPGMEKKDFNINLDNGLLTISTNKEMSNEEKRENYTRKEFSYSAFTRSFTLPETCNTDNIQARYENGILNIMIPKKEEAKAKPPKQIEIS